MKIAISGYFQPLEMGKKITELGHSIYTNTIQERDLQTPNR